MKYAITFLLITAPALAWPQAAKPVRSLLEERQQNVIVQKWETSCGAAALATVMTYQLGYPVTEKQVATAMLRVGSPERVRDRGGFSLLDMKRYAESRGFAANGYAGLTLEKLARSAPMIVPVNLDGYDHFVVFRGVHGGRAILADPAYGNRSMPLERFESAWNGGIGFRVRHPGEEAPGILAAVRAADLLSVSDETVRTSEEELPRPLWDWELARLSFNGALDTTFRITALTSAEIGGGLIAAPAPIVQDSTARAGAPALASVPAVPEATTMTSPSRAMSTVAGSAFPILDTATGTATSRLPNPTIAFGNTTSALRMAETVAPAVTSGASPTVDTAKNTVTNTVRNATDTVNTATSATNTVNGVVSTAPRTVSEATTPVMKAAETTAAAVTGGAPRTVDTAKDTVTNTVRNAIPTNTVSTATNAVNGATKTVNSSAGTVTSTAPRKSDVTTSVSKAAGSTVDTAANAAKNTVRNAGTTDTFKTATSAANGATKTIDSRTASTLTSTATAVAPTTSTAPKPTSLTSTSTATTTAPRTGSTTAAPTGTSLTAPTIR
jgi:predicted double-glycine peptidase